MSPLTTKSNTKRNIPQLLLNKQDVSFALGISVRTLDRMLACGDFPPADHRFRNHPKWLRVTLDSWIEDGCCNENRGVK